MELYFSPSVLWCESYRRNNKSETVKNVLCFPNHSNGSGGFCGEMVVVEILTSLDYEEFPYLIVAEFSSLLKNNISLKLRDLISADEIFSKDSFRKFYFGKVTEKDMLDENIWRYEVHINKELKAWNYPYKTSKNQDYNCHSFFVYILTPVDKTRRIFQCISRIQSPPFQIRCSRRNPSNNQKVIHQNNRNSYNIYKQSQLMKLIHQTEEKLPPDNSNNRISISRENINLTNNDDDDDEEEDYNLPNLNNNNNSSPSSSSSSLLLSPDVMNIFDELDDISNIESSKCPMSKYYSNYNSILSVDNDEENYESLIKKCPYHSKQQQQQLIDNPSSDVVLIPNTFLKSSPAPSSTTPTAIHTQSINSKAKTKAPRKKINKVVDDDDNDDDENRYESCCKANYLFLLPIITLFFIIMIILVYIDSKRSNSYTSVLGEKLMIYQLLLKQLNYHYSCYSDIIKFNTTVAMDFMSKSFENQIDDLLKVNRKSLSDSCQFLLYNTLSDENCSFSQQNTSQNSNLQFYFILGVITIGLFLHVIHRYVILPKVKSDI